MVGPKKQDIWPKINTERKLVLYFVYLFGDSSKKMGMILENRVDQNLKLGKKKFQTIIY